MTVAAYLARLPAPTRAVIDQVRAVLRKALPEAAEVVSYGIIGLRQHDRAVLYLAGWKEHWSLYPASEALRRALGDALGDRVVSKGTIRFELDAKVPTALVTRIAKLRLAEVAADVAAKQAKKVAAKKPAPKKPAPKKPAPKKPAPKKPAAKKQVAR